MGLLDFLFEKDEAEEVELEEETPLKEIKKSPVLKSEPVPVTPIIDKALVVRERPKHISVDEFAPKLSKAKPLEKPKQVYQFAPPISPIFGVMNEKKVDTTKVNNAPFVQKPVISKSKLGTVLSPYYGEGFDVIKTQKIVDVVPDINEEDIKVCPLNDYDENIEMSAKHDSEAFSFDTASSHVDETLSFDIDEEVNNYQTVGAFDHLTLDDILYDEKPEGTKRVINIENISLFDGDDQ